MINILYILSVWQSFIPTIRRLNYRVINVWDLLNAYVTVSKIKGSFYLFVCARRFKLYFEVYDSRSIEIEIFSLVVWLLSSTSSSISMYCYKTVNEFVKLFALFLLIHNHFAYLDIMFTYFKLYIAFCKINIWLLKKIWACILLKLDYVCCHIPEKHFWQYKIVIGNLIMYLSCIS